MRYSADELERMNIDSAAPVDANGVRPFIYQDKTSQSDWWRRSIVDLNAWETRTWRASGRCGRRRDGRWTVCRTPSRPT